MFGAKGSMIARCGSHQPARCIHNNSARSAGANIHSKEPHNTISPYLNRFSSAERGSQLTRPLEKCRQHSLEGGGRAYCPLQHVAHQAENKANCGNKKKAVKTI